MSQCKTNILSNCSSILGFLRTGQLTLISYFNAILIVFYQHFTILSTINKDIIIIIITIIIIIIIIIHLFTGQRGIQNPVKHLRWSLFRKTEIWYVWQRSEYLFAGNYDTFCISFHLTVMTSNTHSDE